mmetsp:Transcript_26385/g.69725  ORF Transcript_26385/g.69725 Transcript_26385/m.69725 type:complete len:246 (-) Transcript_26385:23-760(-)
MSRRRLASWLSAAHSTSQRSPNIGATLLMLTRWRAQHMRRTQATSEAVPFELAKAIPKAKCTPMSYVGTMGHAHHSMRTSKASICSPCCFCGAAELSVTFSICSSAPRTFASWRSSWRRASTRVPRAPSPRPKPSAAPKAIATMGPATPAAAQRRDPLVLTCIRAAARRGASSGLRGSCNACADRSVVGAGGFPAQGLAAKSLLPARRIPVMAPQNQWSACSRHTMAPAGWEKTQWPAETFWLET